MERFPFTDIHRIRETRDQTSNYHPVRVDPISLHPIKHFKTFTKSPKPGIVDDNRGPRCKAVQTPASCQVTRFSTSSKTPFESPGIQPLGVIPTDPMHLFQTQQALLALAILNVTNHKRSPSNHVLQGNFVEQ
ncbi:glutathione S-transferase C-terminal domain-containing protein [Striga asiatica]|uniref:Glutathione S-transferase C-terminal domain-containing protein n=1 Tax=Striga asiatica TaxID=4170 RepID=A0A5A7RCE5_STRAF|nr:glutathione S-transferase C-terminal domain-containing protein [Striga asiatica]